MPESIIQDAEQDLLENLLERSYSLSIINEVLSGINASCHYQELFLKAVVPLMEMVGASEAQIVMPTQRVPQAPPAFDEAAWSALRASGGEANWGVCDERYMARFLLSAQAKPIGELRLVGPAHLLAQLLDLREVVLALCGQLGLALNGIHTLLDTIERALRDGLTGLYNHAHFQTQLRQEADRAARYGSCFSLVMVDVDFFKRINDTYGHPAGDEVLKRVSQALAEALRTSDMACRYGGEEFALLLPGTPLDGAIRLAERLRQQIAALPIEVPVHGSIGPVSASFGCAAFAQGECDPLSLLRRADGALYKAKQQGRDRVCVVLAPSQEADGSVA
ncbi:MAG TPA: GGDEF domain-containing protein [Oscillatoriaceae cyanobacterium]